MDVDEFDDWVLYFRDYLFTVDRTDIITAIVCQTMRGMFSKNPPKIDAFIPKYGDTSAKENPKQGSHPEEIMAYFISMRAIEQRRRR